MIKILIIDDEDKLRSLLARIIKLEGYAVTEAPSLKAGLKILGKDSFDILLCDVKLPDGNGVDFTAEVKTKYASLEIILLTAYGNIQDGIQAMKNGAFDYLIKGDENNKIIPLLQRAAEKIQLQKRIEHLEQQAGKKYDFSSIIGTSAALQQAVFLAKKVAASDASVLLLGETGTGKEVFAQAIHCAGPRSGKPFVALNCSAFAKDLLESELFGYKAGAFTGAIKDKPGLVEEAHTGTLFLDEIGEMNIELQSKLLRVLETNEFIKVGDTKPVKVSVRIIAATHKNLQEEVNKNHFREDLFYRLNVFAIRLPPLRERKEDIPLLADYYRGLFANKTNKHIKGISPAFAQQLQKHYWKGNIRELKNIIERAVILNDSNILETESLPLDFNTTDAQQQNAGEAFDLNTAEKIHIQKVLAYTKGNKTEAARLLNIGLTTLYRKLEEYDAS